MKNKDLHKDKTNNPSISECEKAYLKDRILDTIQKSRLRKRRMHYFLGSVATIVILVSVSYQFIVPTPEAPSITDFVNTSKTNSQTTDKIVLMLGEGESLDIDEEMTEVQYSDNGKSITIGNTKDVNQSLSEDETPVFNTLMIPFGKRSKLRLSDGSIVWLNSGSKLVYPAVFKGDKREVYIEGEAIFEVAHNEDKPFYVVSENQRVKVLGTVFSVTNYSDESSISTILESGSVEISYRENISSSESLEKINITPGTKASYNKMTKGMISEKVDVDSYFSWRKGYLVFKNDNLSYILKRISRYYNLDVKITNRGDAEKETFSGYLNLNEDISKVMASIKESADIQYELKENEIIIN
ncbi:FecR family protein [Allomuricauda sp. F6463D]|uniref:FecR family protein n=1 Tax=Allomuricauda sp. F6463D TaxID=2926409 RepID=UPI001FF6E12B|nr:FecR family protein [Muricauda sp. F6463D]MCK0160558.1 DUF4974 domain-containing protein [Muricauda sp. F6463D]